MTTAARSKVPRIPSEAYQASVAFFERSPEAVLFTAPDGRILDANDAACALLGAPKDEICRRGRSGLADPADDRWTAGVAERSRTGRFHGSLSFRRGDGTSTELTVSSTLFTDANGEQRIVIVMRPPAAKRGTEEVDAAVVDPSGIPNRPAFVHLAELQRRKAAREHVALGLMYARVKTSGGVTGTGRSMDAARASFAALFAEECGWGDVVGRVGRDDFAMLIGNGDGEAELAVVRSLASRLSSHNQHAGTHLTIEVGMMPVDADSSIGTLELLDQAAESMDVHERQPHSSASPLCFFALSDPLTIRPVGPAPSPEDLTLTPREVTILRLLALGSSYKEVSAALFISTNTVKTHATHIYAKLGVTDRKSATAVARNLGLVPRARPAGIALHPAPANAERGRPARRAASGARRDKGRGRRARTASDDASLAERLGLVASELTRADDTDQVLDIISRALLGLKGDAAIVAVIEDDVLLPVASRGYSHDAVPAFFPARLDVDLPLTVSARENRVVCVPNRGDAARAFPELGTSPVARSNAWMTAPLSTGNVVFGALGVSFLEPREFTTQECNYVSAVADLCSLALRIVSPDSGPAVTASTTLPARLKGRAH